MEFKETLELVNELVVTFGIPVAIYQYVITKRKERRDREYLTYNALDEKYIEFQKLCLEYPKLDIFDVPDKAAPPLDDQQKNSKLSCLPFCSLFSKELFYCTKKNRRRSGLNSGAGGRIILIPTRKEKTL
ncbi:MAG TPA: hypothetical protein VGO58_08140 [Chitinophagaceae bacterium]|jgi:hypothetical protein|nr:hypothetical protein [Chitinophagaceae bacterium]